MSPRPPVGGLAGVERLHGVANWLGALKGSSTSSSRTARLRPTHGAALQVEAPSARAHDGDDLGIYPLETVQHVNGGSASTPAPALCNDWSSLIGVQNSSRFMATVDPVNSSGV
jgi:hypothetical protein